MPPAPEWTPHQGGDCPLDPTTAVIVRYRNGRESAPIKARERRWKAWPRHLGNNDWDVVAWRPAPN